MRKTYAVLIISLFGFIFLLTSGQVTAEDLTPPALNITPSAGGFLLTWEPNPGESLVYKIYWGNDQSVDEADYEGMFATSNSEYEHTGLMPDLSYYYRIQACSCECGPLSDTVSGVFQPASTDVLTLSGTLTVNGVASDPYTENQQVRATIKATEVNGANRGNSALVNPDGSYQMTLFSGTYNIYVSYWLGETWHGAQTNVNVYNYPGPQNTKIDGDAVHNITLQLYPLTGVVQDTNGTPISDVELAYQNGGATTSVEAGYEGAYKLYFLEGSYNLQSTPPEGTSFGQATVTVDVPGSAPAIILPTLPLLSGVITLNGASIESNQNQSVSASIQATEINGANSGNTVYANPDGTYEMALEPGIYLISVDIWIWETWHGTGINFNIWGHPGPQNLTFETDTIQNIDVTIYTLTGNVQDSDGSPIPDAGLDYDQGSTTTSDETDFEGAYKLYFLPGTYELEATPPQDSQFGPTVVTVDVPGTAPTIILQTVPMLSGRITLNGAPIQLDANQSISATVRASEVNGANAGGRATVNADGTYQISLLPGTYNILADFRLNETWHGDQISFSAYGNPGAQNFVFNTDMIQDIDITMHTLTGSVINASGAPVPDVKLSSNQGSTTSSVEVDFEGAYKLYFKPGTHNLLVTAPAAVYPPFQVSGIEITGDTQQDIVLSTTPPTDPPVSNEPPVAIVGGPYSGTVGNAVALDAGDSYDSDGDIVQYSWDFDNDGVFDRNSLYPSTTYVWPTPYEGSVRVRVTDNGGFAAVDCVSVSIIDLTPTPTPDPTTDLSVSACPNLLWPPNHKMVPVKINVSSDYFGPEDTCQITSVSSNEPEDGIGDGHFTPDWEITGDLTVDLRAERSGLGSGRIYTITVECVDDASGTTATASTEVVVPQNQKDKKCDRDKKYCDHDKKNCDLKKKICDIKEIKNSDKKKCDLKKKICDIKEIKNNDKKKCDLQTTAKHKKIGTKAMLLPKTFQKRLGPGCRAEVP